MAHSQTINYDHAGHDAHSHHVVPLWFLSFIFAVLLVLTVLTYLVTKVDLGYTMNLVVAMAIAVVKGALVCLYFMHLRWDSPFNALALIASLAFVALFIVIACLDSGQYRKNLDPPQGWVKPAATP
jgi:cytochrome c oxidase subunit IV